MSGMLQNISSFWVYLCVLKCTFHGTAAHTLSTIQPPLLPLKNKPFESRRIIKKNLNLPQVMT